MKKKSYSVTAHFEKYLAQNWRRFRMRLEIAKRDKGSIELRYPGFIPEIMPVLLQRGSYVEIGVYVEHEGANWDCLVDFEVEIKKSRGKYYCGLCETKKICYNLVEELIEIHCFEEFRKWSNRNIRKQNSLALFGCKFKGATAARIVTPDSLKPPKSHELIIPLFNNPASRAQCVNVKSP